MAQYGYTLFCEGFSPKELVRQAVMAEKAGFDFLVVSDHFHPWLPEHSHSGFAWSVLGAVAQATSRISLATMVTCPTVRYHPAIVAQMAATIGVLSDGRFTLGVGAGERLNEHIVGHGWYSPSTRHAMLREALAIIHLLWHGGYQTYAGEYFDLEDARIFDLPEKPIRTFCAAGGQKAAALAAEIAGGICVTEPSKEIIGSYKQRAPAGDTWGQIVLSWDNDEQRAMRTAWEQFRFAGGGWPVQAELPNPANFAAAAKQTKPEDLSGSIMMGPAADSHLQGINQFLEAGIENLAVVYPGQDTAGFLRFWTDELRPMLP